jgi:hypothetical protein
VSFFPETLRPGEVTHNVFALKRVSPRAVRFFGRSGVAEVVRGRGLGGLGGDSPSEEVMPPEVAAAGLASAQGKLANAIRQRKDCDKFTPLSVITGGINMGLCVIKWDGAVSYWKDRVSEWEGALGMAQAQAAAAAAAEATPLPVPTGVKRPTKLPGKTGSAGLALTAAGGLPSWVKIAGGVLLLGGLAYGVSRYTRR